ncbi:MAG: hypothetical protein FJZ38_17580 [Candidatus Rokubacteria bacterium]|nr:hypothetical protein [Candidatus Rokubacteria bacterium]
MGRYRRHRTSGVLLFVLLVLLVGVERHLAEAHLNLRTVAVGLESNDTLDGDELRVRLIVLNDDKPPRLPDVSSALPFERVHPIAQHCASLALGRPAPRGPPSLSAA